MGSTIKTDIDRVRMKGKTLTDIPKRYTKGSSARNHMIEKQMTKEQLESYENSHINNTNEHEYEDDDEDSGSGLDYDDDEDFE